MAKTGSRASRVTLTQVKEYLAQVPEIVKAPSPSEQWMVEAKLADAPNVRMLHDAEQRLRMLDMIDTGIKPRTPPPPPPNTPLNNNMQPLAHSVPSAPLTRDAKGDGLRVSHKAFTKLFGGEMASPTSALRARPKWWSTPIVTPRVMKLAVPRAASAPPLRRSDDDSSRRVPVTVARITAQERPNLVARRTASSISSRLADIVARDADSCKTTAVAASLSVRRQSGRVADQWQARRGRQPRQSREPQAACSYTTDVNAAFDGYVSVNSAWARTSGCPTPPRLRRPPRPP